MRRNRVERLIRTPAIITETLLKYETFEGEILEPCCGDGAICEVLKKHGYSVIASDICDYGYGEVKDMFKLTGKYDNIITNPPFSIQRLVKRYLLPLTQKKLALLWYTKHLGNELETAEGRFLKSVYILGRIKWEININWSFAWYVWEIGYKGDITIKWVNPSNQLEMEEK